MQKLYNEENVLDIAKAIRDRNEEETKYKLKEMSAGVKALPKKSFYEKALSNQFTKEITGELPLYLEDSSDMPFKKFEISGNRKQQKYEGYNLYNKYGDFNYPTNTYVNRTTLLPDGTIKTTANYSSNASRGIRIKNFKQNTTYTISGKLISSNSDVSNRIAVVRIMAYINSWSAIYQIFLDKTGNFKATFNTGNYTDLFISLNGNGTSSISCQAIYDEIMIYEGTMDKPYEPFVEGIASPNPKYPQDIEAVGKQGFVNTTVSNKNLFDVNKVNNLALSSTIISNPEYRGYYIKVNGGEKYNISRKNITGNNRFRICYTTKEPQNGMKFYNDKGDEEKFIEATDLTSIIVIIPNFAKYMFLYLSNNNENITEDLEIQIEQGSTATEYVPHAEQKIKMPVQQEMLEGDYFDWDMQQEVHVWDKIVLDGSGTWYEKSINNGTVFQTSLSVISQNDNNQILAKSNYYIGDTGNNVWNGKKLNTIGVSDGKSLRIYTDFANDISQFKQLLSQNKPTVYYKLATPKRIAFTEEQITVAEEVKNLLSYKGGTHIYSDDNISPVCNIEYYIDKNAIMNKILELGGDI